LQKGEGLGKNKQGRDAPIQVTRKDDSVGLGKKRCWDSQQDFAIQAYETAMAKFTAQENEDDASSDSSDEDIEAFAVIANETSATAKELKLARQLAKGNNLGRFGARAGKLQRIQEQEAVVVAGQDGNPLQRGPSSAPDLVTEADKTTPPVTVATTNPPIVITVGSEDEGAPRSPPAQPGSGWWGHSMFESSGWLSGLHEKKERRMGEVTRGAFTYDTQEAIFKNAMTKKVQVCTFWRFKCNVLQFWRILGGTATVS
jgi:hypothetical protein